MRLLPTLLLLTVCALPSQARPSPPPVPSRGVTPSESPIRLLPGGKFCLTAAKGKVFVPADGLAEFEPVIPPSRGVDFEPGSLFALIDNVNSGPRDIVDGQFDTFRVTMANLRGATRRTVRVALTTSLNKKYLLQDYTLFLQDPGVRPAAEWSCDGDALRLKLANRADVGRTWVFLDEQCLGEVDETGEPALDVRGQPPGKYRVAVVAESKDGVLVPPVCKEVEVAPRFVIDTADGAKAINVPQDGSGMKFGVKVALAGGVRPARVHVFVDSNHCGAPSEYPAVVEVPVREIPSGTVDVTVIGEAADGTLYAPETLQLAVKNLPWEARTYNTPAFDEIQRNRQRLKVLEQQAAEWYERAANEPAFTEHKSFRTIRSKDFRGNNITTTILDTIRVPGKAGEYFAQSRRCVVEMAQLYFRNGQLYRTLNMKGASLAAFLRSHKLAPDTPTGRQAKREAETVKPKPPVL